jgi:hypothetical protein
MTVGCDDGPSMAEEAMMEGKIERCGEDSKENLEKSIISYWHHRKKVFVRGLDQGKHRNHNLCYICSKFHPKGRDFSLTEDIRDPQTGENLGPLRLPLENCEIAQVVYENCVRFGIISPVWECPEFKRLQK